MTTNTSLDHGESRVVIVDGERRLQVWDAHRQQWVDLTSFWRLGVVAP